MLELQRLVAREFPVKAAALQVYMCMTFDELQEVCVK